MWTRTKTEIDFDIEESSIELIIEHEPTDENPILIKLHWADKDVSRWLSVAEVKKFRNALNKALKIRRDVE